MERPVLPIAGCHIYIHVFVCVCVSVCLCVCVCGHVFVWVCPWVRDCEKVLLLSPCLQSIMHLFFKTTPYNYNILVPSTIPILFWNNLTHLGNFPWKFKPPSSSIFYLLPKNIFFSGSGEHIVGVETVFYFYEPIFKSKSLRGPPSPSRKKREKGE